MIILAFLAAAAVTSTEPIRMLEVTDGPVVRSTAADIIHAWQDCANAVQGRDLKVDGDALKRSGWIPTRITVDGKPIGSEPEFYSRPDVNAVIVAGQACVVEGLTNDLGILERLQAPIAERTAAVARERGVKFETWTSEGSPRFSAKPFTVAIYYPAGGSTLVEKISRNLADTKPIKILTVDAARAKK